MVTRRSKSILLALSALVIAGGIYLKQKFYDPHRRFEIAKSNVQQLVGENEIQNGDLIFQTSLSAQSQAIQLATHSEYSHCGIIFKKDEKYFVLEAVQPVKLTLLENWIARGKDGHFVVKRLKQADQVLTSETLRRMKEIGNGFRGKNYDIYFDWSDEKIYCSELIWKIYQRATGLEIGKPEKLRDFDLTNETVKQKMKERYGSHIPFEEPVISPSGIFNSELLVTVKAN